MFFDDIEYAKAYKGAGANGIVMAEQVAGLLSPTLEKEFFGPYVKRIVDAVQDDDFVLVYHNCGDNVPLMLESILSTGAVAYHFGDSIDMEMDIIYKVPADVIVMGNIDPAGVLRMGTPETVRKVFKLCFVIRFRYFTDDTLGEYSRIFRSY